MAKKKKPRRTPPRPRTQTEMDALSEEEKLAMWHRAIETFPGTKAEHIAAWDQLIDEFEGVARSVPSVENPVQARALATQALDELKQRFTSLQLLEFVLIRDGGTEDIRDAGGVRINDAFKHLYDVVVASDKIQADLMDTFAATVPTALQIGEHFLTGAKASPDPVEFLRPNMAMLKTYFAECLHWLLGAGDRVPQESARRLEEMYEEIVRIAAAGEDTGALAS